MSQLSRAGEVSSSTLEPIYAEPRVLFAAACELLRVLRQSVAGLASVPPGAAGGFLQPPQGSHFGTEG